MSKFAITKNEVKTRVAYIILGFFVASLITPVRDWFASVGINHIFVSIIGIIIVLYLFDFK